MDANNYAFNTVANTNANVAQKAITVNAFVADKVYDAKTSATVTNLTSQDIISGDTVVFNHLNANFDHKHVGENKTVTVAGITAGGSDANNYTFASQAQTSAKVTPKAITFNAVILNKAFDNLSTAIVKRLSSDELIKRDGVAIQYATANFNDARVGKNKPVLVQGIKLTGADAANYSFAETLMSTADIFISQQNESLVKTAVENLFNIRTQTFQKNSTSLVLEGQVTYDDAKRVNYRRINYMDNSSSTIVSSKVLPLTIIDGGVNTGIVRQ